MKIVLLPGLDGTGLLFKPLIATLPSNIDTLIITYPPNIALTYQELVEFVINQLPKEDYLLVGESFSGPIVYQVALHSTKYLKSVVFVATFLSNPRPHIPNLFGFLPVHFVSTLPTPILKSLFLGSTVDNQTIKLFKQAIGEVAPNVLTFRLREIFKLSPKHFPSCHLRAIYIQAINDKFISNNNVSIFKQVFKDFHLFKVMGTHFILQANPEACAKIVMNEIRIISDTVDTVQ